MEHYRAAVVDVRHASGISDQIDTTGFSRWFFSFCLSEVSHETADTSDFNLIRSSFSLSERDKRPGRLREDFASVCVNRHSTQVPVIPENLILEALSTINGLLHCRSTVRGEPLMTSVHVSFGPGLFVST